MTEHPLTDEICKSIAVWYPYDRMVDIEDCGHITDMRSAYDLGESKGRADMLEQVTEWISANLWEAYIYVDFSGAYVIDEERFIEDLKEAMRPATKEEES